MFEFRKIREKDLEQILKWRTSERVTRFLFTDVEYDIKQQQNWYRSTTSREDCEYWVVVYKGEPVGLFFLDPIKSSDGNCKYGYYIGEEKFTWLGAFLQPYMINYAFRVLKLNKIIGEVMEGNTNALKMHGLFGYRKVGVLEKHVFKYGMYHNVHVFELLAEDWSKSGSKYNNCHGVFEN